MATMGSLCEMCLERAGYAEFLISKGDNTIEEVSNYVDPPECQKNPICRWKEEWVSNSINKVSQTGHKSSLSPGPDGMEEDTMESKERASRTKAKLCKPNKCAVDEIHGV